MIKWLKVWLISWVLINTAWADDLTTKQLIQTSVKEFMQVNGVPGAAVLLYKNGKISSYYFGYAVPKKHILVSENTIFEIGSITKTFTGLLFAENIADGKMQLTDPAIDYLPFKTSNAFHQISLLNLATHTSSLPYSATGLAYNTANSTTHKLALEKFLASWQLPYPIGSQMLYSNLGFGLLGDTLANAAHTSLADLMEQTILKPLGMLSAGLDLNSIQKKNLAQGFTAAGQPAKPNPSGLFAGAWAMKASPKDMQAYLLAVLDAPGTPATIAKAMQIAETPYYGLAQYSLQLGLGWMMTPLDSEENIIHLINQPRYRQISSHDAQKLLSPIFNRNALIDKTGTTLGFRAYIAIIPKTNTGIVILINRSIAASGALPNLANSLLFKTSGLIK